MVIYDLVERRISIHAAREGGDDECNNICYNQNIFQSTPPVKAATAKPYRVTDIVVFQSTPPVKAATADSGVVCALCVISIHAAREGGDAYACVTVHLKRISIHAAREGGDIANRD